MGTNGSCELSSIPYILPSIETTLFVPQATWAEAVQHKGYLTLLPMPVTVRSWSKELVFSILKPL